MATEYIKTWPDLMAGKKILYVHGFASSGQSGTVTLLKTILPEAEVIAPDLPLPPFEAIELLHEVCRSENPDLIIGSSMGGMMAEQLHGYYRILVNPAFQMGDTMGSHGMIGKLTFQNPRKDGVQEMIVTKATVKEYRLLTENCFCYKNEEDIPTDDGKESISGIPACEDQKVFALFGDRDPLVHTRELFLSHYTQGIDFHGEHRLVDSIVHHSLVPVVRWIDDIQEGRQRETIYIDTECLRNRKNEAAPSMLKAVESLLDNYNLFFVSPSPTNNPERISETMAWLKEYVGVPAFNHSVFTNSPELLYGDFYIAPNPPKNTMATAIEFGSDQFKTWEEIITYFSRLK